MEIIKKIICSSCGNYCDAAMAEQKRIVRSDGRPMNLIMCTACKRKIKDSIEREKNRVVVTNKRKLI